MGWSRQKWTVLLTGLDLVGMLIVDGDQKWVVVPERALDNGGQQRGQCKIENQDERIMRWSLVFSSNPADVMRNF